ncbi:MAG: hypothetical protein KGL39_26630 [Patescibacteria group bacterium]|nr:hypothetical protein [Patescibacteria group bacterium]
MDVAGKQGANDGCARFLKGFMLGVVVVLAVLIICGQSKENFVSAKAQEVFGQAKQLFEAREGKPSYSELKMRVPSTDPVQYADLKQLWKNKQFTPEKIESVL